MQKNKHILPETKNAFTDFDFGWQDASVQSAHSSE